MLKGRGSTRVLCAMALAVVLAQPSWGQTPVSGTLHIVWDTEERGAASHYVVGRDGSSSRLLMEGLGDSVDELLRLDRQRIEVGSYTEVPGAEGVALRTSSVRSLAMAGPMMATGASSSTYDFVTVLCRFADDETTPFTRAEIEEVHGAAYPGVRNFFAELSWNPEIMRGSRVIGWYTLPKPRSEYVSVGSNLGALARDCTQAAEQDIDFHQFHGINLQFSSGLSPRPVAPYDTLSFGGSWTLTLNGASRSWGVTWLSASHASTRVVLTHEIGHALGWPHSSGTYGSEYDSEWDVMSRGYLRWEPPHGWLTVHTIGHHKDIAGWVSPERRWAPASGTIESGLLSRTALPPQQGYLLARIPVASGGSYTAETRRQAGQDQPLPGEAVVLHRVLFHQAFVVDADQDGDPNDEGSQWRPGEEFEDSTAGFSLRVDSATSTGFHVTITRGWRLDIAVAGAGRVSASIAGGQVECDSACSEVVTTRGTQVTLAPAAVGGAVFSHWEGACAGGGTCAVELTANRAVNAVFLPALELDVERVIDHLLTGTGLTEAEARFLDLAGNRNDRVDVGDVRRWIEHGPVAAGSDVRLRAILGGKQ